MIIPIKIKYGEKCEAMEVEEPSPRFHRFTLSNLSEFPVKTITIHYIVDGKTCSYNCFANGVAKGLKFILNSYPKVIFVHGNTNNWKTALLAIQQNYPFEIT